MIDIALQVRDDRGSTRFGQVPVRELPYFTTVKLVVALPHNGVFAASARAL